MKSIIMMMEQQIIKEFTWMRVLSYILIGVFLFFISEINAQKRPFASVKVKQGIYFDETEVDVGSWLSYYSWVLIHEGFEAAQKTLPDSTAIAPEVWSYMKRKSSDYIDIQGRYSLQPIGYFSKECIERKTLDQNILSKSKFCPLLNLPITGVTFEQVLEFCKWRTKVQGENKIMFRLPTSEEWIDFALNGLSETENLRGYKDSITNSKCANYNFKSVVGCSADIVGKLNSIGMYMPDKNGAFDVFGNISEMTSTKGVAKGGNYKIFAFQCHPDSSQNYNKPQLWLGFRCIAVENGIINKEPDILEKKDDATIDSKNNKYDKFTDPRDAKEYLTVRIGNQVWFATNLSYKPDSGKYWVYENTPMYINQYGYLYTWSTAKNACPIGWHLPSKEEFETLLEFVGGAGKSAYKEMRPSGSSGFSVLDCPVRYGLNYTPLDIGTAYWSSTEKSKRDVWGLGIDGNKKDISLYYTYGKNSGLPVRCIKD